MTKHRKQYRMYDSGVCLMCGGKEVAQSPYILTNWQITNCQNCGMDVQTTGESPDTDIVEEFVYERHGEIEAHRVN